MSYPPMHRQLLRRQLHAAPPQRVAFPARHIGRRRYGTSDKGDRDDFKGQLYQSTSERIGREKADYTRFAQLRAAEKAARGPPTWLVPFGKSVMPCDGGVLGRVGGE